MAITYDEHAEFQIARRGIDKAWSGATLLDPDQMEVSGRRRSALKCLLGRRVMPRAVTPADKARKRGPARTKEAVSIRLDKDLVARLRATGAGWQSRVNDVLRAWADEHLASS